jgi:glutathionyl-hydroquinone reductase
MRKLAVNPLASGWQTGVERVGARRRPLAVFRNRFSGASRMTAPVLCDEASRLIFSNESSEIPRIREVAR